MRMEEPRPPDDDDHHKSFIDVSLQTPLKSHHGNGGTCREPYPCLWLARPHHWLHSGAIDSSGLDRCYWNEFLVSKPSLFECIHEVKISFDKRKQRDVRCCPDLQSSQTFGESKEVGGIRGCPLNHLFWSEPEMEELRKCRCQIKHRAVDVELMHIA